MVFHRQPERKAVSDATQVMYFVIRSVEGKKATMSIVLLLMLCCAFFPSVNGNFTISTPLKSADINCLESYQCEFFVENQTIAIINITEPRQAVSGVAYYTTPIRMKDPATNRVASFNTSFKFREEPMNYSSTATSLTDFNNFKRGDGFTFLFSNSNTWRGEPAGRFGVFTLVPESSAKVLAVEFDSWSSTDTDPGLLQEEHVGLDVRSAISVNSCFSYVQDKTGITFWHRDVLYAWIEYDGATSNLQIRLANTSSRPSVPLINCVYELNEAVDEKMWIGFSGAHGDAWSVYYIYDWTFTSYGISSEFSSASKVNVGLVAGVATGGISVALLAVAAICVYFRKKRARDDIWDTEEMIEMGGMPEFISYKHLSSATKQFSNQSKLGEGGFGSVYRGVLPKTGAEVAVKKVSNNSRQGEKEFLAEVRIISQLRHRNVVELNGFCRDKGKLLLVYELLPRGSVDQALFNPRTAEEVLSWGQRWKIVSGTAAALHYLHEGWRQQVIHRDVKSSNIMLDEECNPKLGDFGLARLVDHEKHAATTMVAGTYGFIAPEAVGGKFTDKTDVFAFGAVTLELACGRKAYNPNVKSSDDLVLVDVVWRRLKDNNLLSVADPLLLGNFDAEQMCIVLKLGLLCSHPDPACRPSMRQVVQVLAGDADVPDVPESKPDSSYLGKGLPYISIDDLMSSRSGTGNSESEAKRLLSRTPYPSTSSSRTGSLGFD